MNHEINDFASQKQFSSTLALGGVELEIDLETPSLSGCAHSVWGDWGPVYHFDVDDSRTVALSYRSNDLDVEGTVEMHVPKIDLQSPALAVVREKHPLIVTFEVPSLGLAFDGYLDEGGQPARLEIKTRDPERAAQALLQRRVPQRAA